MGVKGFEHIICENKNKRNKKRKEENTIKDMAKAEQHKGVIYILTNPSFYSWVKIGYADDVEKRVNEAISQLRKLSIHDIDFNQMDPVAKMMLIALISESQKIQDHMDGMTQRIIDRFCTDFIPREKIEAIPAIALVNPSFKPKKETGIVSVGTGASFSYKTRTKPTYYVSSNAERIMKEYEETVAETIKVMK